MLLLSQSSTTINWLPMGIVSNDLSFNFLLPPLVIHDSHPSSPLIVPLLKVYNRSALPKNILENPSRMYPMNPFLSISMISSILKVNRGGTQEMPWITAVTVVVNAVVVAAASLDHTAAAVAVFFC